jgi:hypothetical protein
VVRVPYKCLAEQEYAVVADAIPRPDLLAHAVEDGFGALYRRSLRAHPVERFRERAHLVALVEADAPTRLST